MDNLNLKNKQKMGNERKVRWAALNFNADVYNLLNLKNHTSQHKLTSMYTMACACVGAYGCMWVHGYLASRSIMVNLNLICLAPKDPH